LPPGKVAEAGAAAIRAIASGKAMRPSLIARRYRFPAARCQIPRAPCDHQVNPDPGGSP
jgi:hypothetical protein